ncbi:serine/threonine-protein kinase [Paramagnetospirillum magneticum]|uniref:Serine/threonine protein kinase n=1 Tax=Paramagnetospirillum magneticum (strain ATCC 700264 / AMB-1) TaxID=342108 RepID=Q2W0L9_PARM1|nr:serine/threonine-protein kinase [Paramagnetospirillum magneticum]BAE52606.1 Serine/threonine protein kinase [Paramagnetospirillum magneticum AMB-1]
MGKLMERIGKYVIHTAVVTTGYSRVFLCHDPDLQVPVAAKLFDPKPGDDSLLSPAQQLSRFLTEVRTLASFDHPYIVGVKTLEHLADGRPYFVMPYMAAHLPYEIGKDFPTAEAAAAASERDRPRRMNGSRAMLVMKQLSSAVLALHKRGLVHRFLKPSNVLLSATQNGAVKLCDFSLIKLAEKNLPLPGFWMGDAAYTAPEQMENATAVDSRADVYSLGVLAYRLLIGGLPDLSVPAVLPGGFPEQLAALVAACTDPDPSRRPPHAGDVLGALDRVPAPSRPAAAKPTVQVVASKPRPQTPAAETSGAEAPAAQPVAAKSR